MMPKKMPKTDSIQELADFWDTHDLADFEDQLEEVKEPVFERRWVITLHLPEKDATALHEIATRRGVPDEHIVLEWVREKTRTA